MPVMRLLLDRGRYRCVAGAPALVALWLLAGLPALGEEPRRVLFIGNSYLRDNGGVHTHVAAMARAGTVETASATIGGGYLHQHDIDVLLAQGRYDMVIVQGHSTATTTPEKRTRFRAAVRRLHRAIAAHGAEMRLYVTPAYGPAHPRFDPGMGAMIADGYGVAAAETGALIVPVRRAFEIAQTRTPEIVLHMPDGSHPTLHGTYLAAAVTHLALHGPMPNGRVYTMGGALTEAEATALWRSAEAASALSACPVGNPVADTYLSDITARGETRC